VARRPGPAALRALVVVLTVALVAATVLLVVTWRRADHEHALRAAGRSADAAARRVAVELTTYDYRTIGDAYDWVDRDGTARFRKQFASVSADARASVVALRVVATGTVIASAPDVVDTQHVRVLLFVDQQVRSTNSTGSRTEEPRLRMDMVRVGGRWLVDAVQRENSLT
jgi:Mce-associated membrane protein